MRVLHCPPGLKVGHATDHSLRSGVTVFLPDRPAVAAVQVTGGAPATRETDLLKPGNLVERVDAIVLSGGSAFGLSAADGVTAWLSAAGRGFAVGEFRVPIVPAASLFDLANGGDKTEVTAGRIDRPSPYAVLGHEACAGADTEVPLGSVGAGTGATTADLKGGFGAASHVLSNGATVAAFVAANPVGSVMLGSAGHFRAAPHERDGEFGGLGWPVAMPPNAAIPRTKFGAAARGNTTIAVVATDLDLTRDQASRLAVSAHDGIAISVFPAHTPFDGDTVFTLATGSAGPADRLDIVIEASAAAASTLARAIARAVYEAERAHGDRVPAWRARFGPK